MSHTDERTVPLDSLAANLSAAAKRAEAAVAGAQKDQALDQVRAFVSEAAASIGESLRVLEASEIQLTEEEQRQIDERRASVSREIGAVREILQAAPETLRAATAWRDARSSIEALQRTAAEVSVEAYERVMDGYASGDRALLQALVPGLDVVSEYRQALDEFESRRDTTPRGASEVREAVKVGQNLQRLRESLEANSMPESLRSAWRELSSPSGISLADLTPEFRQWLDEQGLSRQVTVRFSS